MRNEPIQPRLAYHPAEVAAMHGVSLKTVERAIARGKLPFTRAFGRRVWGQAALVAGDLLREIEGGIPERRCEAPQSVALPFERPPRRDIPLNPRRRGFVYFVQVMDTVKIGFSKNPKKRLESLKTLNAHASRILRQVSGDVGTEKKFHYKFRQHHIRGEWFRLEGALRKWLASKGCLDQSDAA